MHDAPYPSGDQPNCEKLNNAEDKGHDVESTFARARRNTSADAGRERDAVEDEAHESQGVVKLDH